MTTEYLIRLPWPPTKSSPNGSQGDFYGKASAGKSYKKQCAVECMAQGVRPILAGSVSVEVTFHPPTARAYDLDNMLARCKRGLDAVAEAIRVDDADWQAVDLRRGEKVKGGAVLVHVRTPDAWRRIGDIAADMVKGSVT
jgi:crossover junction endodeoxyribonuclease RusA